MRCLQESPSDFNMSQRSQAEGTPTIRKVDTLHAGGRDGEEQGKVRPAKLGVLLNVIRAGDGLLEEVVRPVKDGYKEDVEHFCECGLLKVSTSVPDQAGQT